MKSQTKFNLVIKQRFYKLIRDCKFYLRIFISCSLCISNNNLAHIADYLRHLYLNEQSIYYLANTELYKPMPAEYRFVV